MEIRGDQHFQRRPVIRGGQIVEAEVYVGWNVPHAAPDGSFID